MTALITPVVTVWESPKGFPIAMTVSPIIRSPDCPMGISGSDSSASILRTARSDGGSAPINRAENSLPSASDTRILVAP